MASWVELHWVEFRTNKLVAQCHKEPDIFSALYSLGFKLVIAV